MDEGVSLETSPITKKHSPKENIIQIPLEEKYFIRNYSKNVVDAQNPRISLPHSCQSKKKIFEHELQGFIFFLSLDSACLHESDY